MSFAEPGLTVELTAVQHVRIPTPFVSPLTASHVYIHASVDVFTRASFILSHLKSWMFKALRTSGQHTPGTRQFKVKSVFVFIFFVVSLFRCRYRYSRMKSKISHSLKYDYRLLFFKSVLCLFPIFIFLKILLKGINQAFDNSLSEKVKNGSLALRALCRYFQLI